MSHENPFTAPANDGVAPPSFAAPQHHAEAPAGAVQPPYPGMPEPGQLPYPGAQPYAGVPAAPPRPPRSNRGLAIAMLVLSALYIVLCLIEIFALNHRVSVANDVINNPDSVTFDQANSADSTVAALSVMAIVTFLGTIIVLSIWQRALRRTWGATGRYQALLKESGYQIFRVVWLASIVMAVLLRGTGNFATPQDVVSHDHQYMVYYALRAALGAVLIYFTLRFMRVSERAVALAQSGYSPDAVSYLSS